jgi:hypothetical protein
MELYSNRLRTFILSFYLQIGHFFNFNFRFPYKVLSRIVIAQFLLAITSVCCCKRKSGSLTKLSGISQSRRQFDMSIHQMIAAT